MASGLSDELKASVLGSLKQQITVAELLTESLELDRLGPAETALTPAIEDFIEDSFEAGDQLWSFASIREYGYVILRNGKFVDFFISMET